METMHCIRPETDSLRAIKHPGDNAAARNVRNNTVDLARFLAAFGVVIIHTSPGDLLAARVTQIFTATAVPFFLICSLYFLLRKPAPAFQTIKISRLVTPYIAWSLIYFGLRCFKHTISSDAREWDYLHVIFFGGAASQLYFIPMLLCYQILAITLVHVFSRVQGIRSLVDLAIIACFYCADPFITSFGYLGFKSLFANAILYAIVAAAVVSAEGKIQNHKRSCLLAATLGILSLYLILSGSFPSRLLTPFMAGCILFFCLEIGSFTPAHWIKTVLSTSYGVFLCHLVFDEFFDFSLPRLGLDLLPYDLVEKLSLASVVTVLSVLLVLAIRKSPSLRRILLGEG